MAWTPFATVSTVYSMLNNGRMLPLTYIDACNAGWFDLASDCLAEALIKTSQGGSIGVVASSRISWYIVGWDKGDGLNQEFDYLFWEAFFIDNLHRPGNTLYYSKWKYYNAGFDLHGWAHKKDFLEYNLLGDPFVLIWTDIPSSLTVEGLPSTVYPGNVELHLTVKDAVANNPVEDAVVTLVKDNEIYEVENTDANGRVDFYLTGVTLGVINVTATKENYIPFLDEILVVEYVNVTVEALWNELREEVKIRANATCSVCGEVTSGTVTYEIFYWNDISTGISGTMVFNDTSRKWEAVESTVNLPLGTYKVNVTVVDAAGHTGPPGQALFTIEDTIGPTSYDVSVSPTPTNVNPVVTASLEDFNHRSNIASSEYFIDSTGPDGTGYPMNPVDGSYNSPVENVEATIDISTLSDGEHVVYVHGVDEQGNWGDYGTATFIVDKTPPEVSDITVTPIRYPTRINMLIRAKVVDAYTGVAWVKAHVYHSPTKLPK